MRNFVERKEQKKGVRNNPFCLTSHAEKSAAPKMMQLTKTSRQLVMGMVTSERSSTSLNLTTSSMLDTDIPDFLEVCEENFSKKDVPLPASACFTSSCFGLLKFMMFLIRLDASLLFGPLFTIRKLFSRLIRLQLDIEPLFRDVFLILSVFDSLQSTCHQTLHQDG